MKTYKLTKRGLTIMCYVVSEQNFKVG